MEANVKGIPEGSSRLIPRLFCRDPAAAIEFCVHTFKAVELGRRPGPNGQVAHALLTVGPAMIMIEAEWPSLPSRAPALDASSPVVIFVYVEDVDQTVASAVSVGAHVLVPAQDQFWGDRVAWIMDPSGHVWTVATRIEEPSEPERRARWSSILDGAGFKANIESIGGSRPEGTRRPMPNRNATCARSRSRVRSVRHVPAGRWEGTAITTPRFKRTHSNEIARALRVRRGATSATANVSRSGPPLASRR